MAEGCGHFGVVVLAAERGGSVLDLEGTKIYDDPEQARNQFGRWFRNNKIDVAFGDSPVEMRQADRAYDDQMKAIDVVPLFEGDFYTLSDHRALSHIVFSHGGNKEHGNDVPQDGYHETYNRYAKEYEST